MHRNHGFGGQKIHIFPNPRRLNEFQAGVPLLVLLFPIAISSVFVNIFESDNPCTFVSALILPMKSYDDDDDMIYNRTRSSN